MKPPPAPPPAPPPTPARDRQSKRRALLVLHRWLGIVSAVFLVIFALTGLALNHTERLGLDRIQVRNGFVLKRYGMEPASSLSSFRIGKQDSIHFLDGILFHNRETIGQGGLPVGTWSGERMRLIATPEALFLLTPDGELVEKLGPDALPALPLEGLGRDASGSVGLVAGGQLWISDPGWIRFNRQQGPFSLIELEAVQLPEDEIRMLLSQYRGEGVSLYRVLLDLHSGRLLGLGGRLVMDLAALAVLALVSSGIAGWRRRSGNRRV